MIKPKVNDILVASYGYNQTNYIYFQVVKVSAKTITIKNLRTNQIFKNKRVKYYQKESYSVDIDNMLTANYTDDINSIKQVEEENYNPYSAH